MITDKRQPGTWMDVASIILAFGGALVSIAAAIGFYTSQAGVGSGPLWPLPGLVLLGWALLGASGFFAAYQVIYKGAVPWMGRFWAISGALLPLIILGAFSIGTLVLVVFVLFLASAILLAIRKGTTALSSLGMFLLGAVISGLVWAVVIFAGHPALFSQAG